MGVAAIRRRKIRGGILWDVLYHLAILQSLHQLEEPNTAAWVLDKPLFLIDCPAHGFSYNNQNHIYLETQYSN